MQPIYLFNEQYKFKSKIKFLIKFFLNKSFRGPQAVEQSLLKGFEENKTQYFLNKFSKNIEIAGVLSGVETLKQVLAWKKQGYVKKIIAGPNLVVTPEDFGSIIQDPNIDIVLQPSQWSKDFYVSLAPNLNSKIEVWPAGVEIPNSSSTQKKYDFLVYNKLEKSDLFNNIINFLKENNFKFRILNYGTFKQSEYFELLEQSKYLIYLSNSESQGLAMFEAWARNVPSLVWERGVWQYGKYSWKGKTASFYVTNENGLIFEDFSDFLEKIKVFVAFEFQSQKYVENNFSFKKIAEKYLNIAQK